MRLEHLAEADRQRQALPARRIPESLVQMTAVEFGRMCHVEPLPGMSEGPGLGVVRGEIGKVKLYPRVGQRNSLAGRRRNRRVRADGGRRENSSSAPAPDADLR